MGLRRRATLLLPLLGLTAQAKDGVRIGQASPALSFLPIMAARALGGFDKAGLGLDWAAIGGGDTACLAALEGGGIDLAAVGGEALLGAVAKGQPFVIVASLMSKVPLELVVSNRLVERTGVDPADDPLPKRLAALKGATVGVSASGGTEERAVRFLARQGKLDPRSDVQVAVVGAPAAIQAALEAGRIDAFVLPPPDGLLSEDARTGKVLVRLGEEFPSLAGVPSLVLAAKAPVEAKRALVVRTLAVLQGASAAVLGDPAAAAAAIQAGLFPGLKPPVMAAAVAALKPGIAERGRLSATGMAALVAYAGEAAAGLDAASGEGKWWTNGLWEEAAR